jgi:hypothetical protein
VQACAFEHSRVSLWSPYHAGLTQPYVQEYPQSSAVVQVWAASLHEARKNDAKNANVRMLMARSAFIPTQEMSGFISLLEGKFFLLEKLYKYNNGDAGKSLHKRGGFMEKDQTRMVYYAIVAIVAIVAIFLMIMLLSPK